MALAWPQARAFHFRQLLELDFFFTSFACAKATTHRQLRTSRRPKPHCSYLHRQHHPLQNNLKDIQLAARLTTDSPSCTWQAYHGSKVVTLSDRALAVDLLRHISHPPANKHHATSGLPFHLAQTDATLLEIDLSTSHHLAPRYVLVPRNKQGEELPPPNLPRRSSRPRLTMQLLPHDVLQELQHKAQEENGRESGGSGEEARGRRGVGADTSPEANETSVPFSPAHSAHSTPPPSPPLDGESPGIPRWEAIQVPRRGRDGDEFEVEIKPPSSLQRSRDRSGAPIPPSRTSTSTTVPPQLLGGRAGSDACSLRTSSGDCFKDYKASQLQATSAQLRSVISSNPIAIVPISKSSSRVTTWDKSADRSRPVTPVSRKSSPVNTLSSLGSSEESTASSFAFALRRQRPDLRLLKKKSKPSQHLTGRPPAAPPFVEPQRSPSFYQPKVVEESGHVQSTTIGIKPPPTPDVPVALRLPEPDIAEPSIKPLKRTQTLGSKAIPQLPVPKVERPQQKWPILSRSLSTHVARPPEHPWSPGPESSPVSATLQPQSLPSRQLRFQSQQTSGLRRQDSSKAQRSIALQLKDLPRKTSMPQNQTQFSAITPSRGVFPGTGQSQGQSDYFMAFPTETMHAKEFVPVRTPVEGPTPEHPPSAPSLSDTVLPNLPEPLSAVSQPLIRSDSSQALIKKRKRSNVFGYFRRTAFGGDEEVDSPFTNHTSPSQQDTPGIYVHSPDDTAPLRRKLSAILPETPLPPYFARPRFRRGPSQDESPSPSPRTASPMPTIEDDEGHTQHPHRSRYHNRSSSEQLSPTATPRNRPRLSRRRHVLENIHDETGNSSPSPGHARSAGSLRLLRTQTNPSPKAPQSPSSETRDAANGPTLANDHPLEEGAVSPAHRKELGAFGDMFHELRKTRSVHLSNAAEGIAWARTATFRQSVASKLSLRRLSVRASKSAKSILRPKRSLRRKSTLRLDKPLPDLPLLDDSQSDSESTTVDEPEQPRYIITPADLEVTEFEQTPFSQRYNDSKRALQQQIRSLVQEGMDEDDEADEEIVLGFEQDVPDHFPNSPLCPLHPKHKSGGKAICPLHGRYKKSTNKAIIRVGPARSRRVLSVQSLRPGPEGETDVRMHRRGPSSESVPSKNRMEIVFDTMILEQAKARTRSMGSDGADLQPSPTGSDERSWEEWRPDCRRPSESETRGRTKSRAECGSQRIRRRRARMRRR